jgi:hypothetical protein
MRNLNLYFGRICLSDGQGRKANQSSDRNSRVITDQACTEGTDCDTVKSRRSRPPQTFASCQSLACSESDRAPKLFTYSQIYLLSYYHANSQTFCLAAKGITEHGPIGTPGEVMTDDQKPIKSVKAVKYSDILLSQECRTLISFSTT